MAEARTGVSAEHSAKKWQKKWPQKPKPEPAKPAKPVEKAAHDHGPAAAVSAEKYTKKWKAPAAKPAPAKASYMTTEKKK